MKVFARTLMIAFILLLTPACDPHQSRLVFAPQKQKVPAGFIAVAPVPMNWDDAKAFCQQQGGRLPLLGGMTKWNGQDPPVENLPIDGFGILFSPWPSGLPEGDYWTGTAFEGTVFTAPPASLDRPGDSWALSVSYYDGNVGMATSISSRNRRVACLR